jgi:hypothetical protein
MKKLLFLLAFMPLISFSQIVKPKLFFQQEDKQLHILAGAAISQAVYYYYNYERTGNKTTAVMVSLASTYFIAWCKEVYDDRKGGSGFDKNDVNATMVGACIIIPISFIKTNKHEKFINKFSEQ